MLTAIGIALYDVRTGDNANLENLDQLFWRLSSVQWDKSTPAGAHRWAGIAGKLTESGNFSAAGGVKDLGTLAYEALTNPSSNLYSRIRPS